MKTEAFCATLPKTVEDVTFLDKNAFTLALREFLRKNEEASRRFVRDSAKRDAWFVCRRFRPTADLCIDGRVQDFGQAIGVPVGILEMFRSKGSTIRLTNAAYRARCAKSVRSVAASHEGEDFAEMRMFTAHHSASRPETASCAAWEHRTDDALADAQERCHELNFVWRGRMVAFPVLIDTDLDAITLFGPGGNFPVERLVRRLRQDEPPDTKAIVDALHQVFPSNWEPIAHLPKAVREEFHVELAERVKANVAFVRDVIASERPVELLEHNERLIFVGRHADWIDEHNTVFLIDDTEGEEAFASFRIALKYVAKNVILDAIFERECDWKIPVIVNIPHDGDDDARDAVLHARTLRDRLRETIERCALELVAFLRGPHGIDPKQLPDWMFREMFSIQEHVEIATCTSERATRLYVPFA
ncbi:MAG: hypothetical protein V1745_01265 [Patescibacteria group bacterium]